MCEALRIPFEEFPILEKDLHRADELLICNTTSEILPVIQVDNRAVGDGKPGLVTRALQGAYREMARF